MTAIDAWLKRDLERKMKRTNKQLANQCLANCTRDPARANFWWEEARRYLTQGLVR